jgi:DNA-binding SARP family transcriptional activator/tetratricopeptide (TPR) repeat protein
MVETSAQLLLFGPPELRLENRVVALPTRKLLALLAYLALEGPTTRSRLAELLWDRADERARANLRGELYRLKKTALRLEDRGERLALTGISSDIEDFERHVAQGDWVGALMLHRGVLLEGFELPDALEFEAWLALTRERWEERFNEVLALSAGGLERDGNADEALATHRWLLSREPLREDSHRAVMRLLVQASEPAQALEHYRRFAAFLEREMGLEPSVAMQEFVRTLGAGGSQAGDLEPLVPATPPSLNAPPLVGRESVWAKLERAPTGLALIVGEAGVGKTRLATDFARAKGSLLVVPHRELAAQVGFGGLIEGLRERFETGWRPRDLEPIWRTEAARLLPELADGEPGKLGGAPETEGADEARFREGLARTLLNTLQPGGAILMDDLQWADESTLRFLPYLVRRAARASVRVIGTTRPEGLEPGGWLGRAVRELEREGLNQRVQLAPLEEADVLKLVRGLSGTQGGTVFSERLHTATQGNAFYVLETLRALFERGELKADTDGWHTPYDEDTHDYNELRLPESVLESVRQRFYRLEELPRRVAELLALCGRDLDPATLELAAQGGSRDVVDALEVLERTGLVRGGPHGYRLAHDLSRAALDEGFSSARRVTLHARLCEVLSHAPSEPGLAAEVLRHAQAARNWSVVRDWAERAAHEAITRYAHREVAELFAQALEAHARLEPDTEREIQVRLEREEALYHLADREAQAHELERLRVLIVQHPGFEPELSFRAGRWSEVRGQFEEAARHYSSSTLQKSKLRLVYALEHLGTLKGALQVALEVFESPSEPEDAFQAALLLAEITQERGLNAEAEGWLTQAEHLIQGQTVRRLRFVRVCARLLYHAGSPERALEFAITGERLGAETGSILDEAICANARAVTLQSLNRYGEAIPVLERVRAFAAQIEHTPLWAVSTGNLGLAHFQIGECAKALEVTLEVFDRGVQGGDRGGEATTTAQLVLIHAYRGDAQAAHGYLETALSVPDANFPLWQRASLLYCRSLVAALEERFEDAARFLREELTISRTLGPNWVLSSALLGVCLLRSGKPDEALEHSSAAIKALPERGLELPPQQVPWAHAQILHAIGDDVGAQVALERALEILERSSRLPGVQRESYLEAFAFNRDIRAAIEGIWPDPPRLI